MLADFDQTLKQLLIQRTPLDANEVEISFDCPRREWSSKILRPTVNLYLYDLRENSDLRQPGWTTQRGDGGGPSGRRRPPIHVDLSYFITAWARNIADEHHLLWHVMLTLMREQSISADVLQGSMRQLGPPVKTQTAQADGVLRNAAEFWGALDNDLKPAITYTATVVADLDVLVAAPLVLSRAIDLGDTQGGHTERLIGIGGIVRIRSGKEGVEPQAVAGAHVTFPELGMTARSDDQGRYVISRVPEGTHRVRVVTEAGAATEGRVQVPASSYDLEV